MQMCITMAKQLRILLFCKKKKHKNVLSYVCVCLCVSKVKSVSSKQLVHCEMSIKICSSATMHHSVPIPDDLQLDNLSNNHLSVALLKPFLEDCILTTSQTDDTQKVMDSRINKSRVRAAESFIGTAFCTNWREA